MSKTHRISLGGLELVPDLSGALYVPDYKALLVADLHLEKASNMARRGVHLPPYDTRASLMLLESTISHSRPEQLIFLGDSFHDDGARERIADDDLRRLRAISGQTATVWISGNHDRHPPTDIGGRIADEVTVGPVTLRHEPRPLGPEEFEIAGHLHPGAAVSQRGKRIHCKCFIGNASRLIMPAFGSFTGGLSISADPFKQLFASPDFHVWMLGNRAIFKFPARRVR